MTRFLWLSNPEDTESEFLVYRFKSVLFGSTSLPFMLNAAIHTHLESFDSPVVQDMKDNLYVDNIITGCATDENAVKYYNESRKVMSEAHFNLRSWSSNSKELREIASRDVVLDMDGDNANVLGLRWNTTTDTLTLTQKVLSNPDSPITKREILRESSKIHDPLGLISPVTVNAKILIQDLWQQNVDWDETLKDEMKDRWLKIAEDIQQSSFTNLPRCYFKSHSSEATTQLHVFVDASPKAYGAVAYLRHGNQTTFVMAKLRVAPLKKHTLPRLELMAALVGARLAEFLQNALKTQFTNLEVILWSDSQIVLHWLNSCKKLQQFVRNRVQKITRLFAASHWRYCRTSDNPADLLTRGVTAHTLQSSAMWLNGPSWLTDECNWPMWESTTILLLEVPESTESSAEPDAQLNSPMKLTNS